VCKGNEPETTAATTSPRRSTFVVRPTGLTCFVVVVTIQIMFPRRVEIWLVTIPISRRLPTSTGRANQVLLNIVASPLTLSTDRFHLWCDRHARSIYRFVVCTLDSEHLCRRRLSRHCFRISIMKGGCDEHFTGVSSLSYFVLSLVGFRFCALITFGLEFFRMLVIVSFLSQTSRLDVDSFFVGIDRRVCFIGLRLG
jgi:hypothetical protein